MENVFAPRFDQHKDPHPNQIAFEDARVRLLLKEVRAL